jgi:transglutaminase-like putative cysteine protease
MHNERKAAEKIRSKLESGTSPKSLKAEVKGLRDAAEELYASHLALLEIFTARDAEVQALGEKARTRHAEMKAAYTKSMDDFYTLVRSLEADGNLGASLKKLDALFSESLYKKRALIAGALPYRHVGYPAQTPPNDTTVVPAYDGGPLRSFQDEDLASTTEAPISEEIALKAQELGWSPVAIYEWVKNNVQTEWYWGCMKGAEETLRQLGGNDCDQSTLLVALLRASGYPARYVQGTMEFYPNLAAGSELLGIDDTMQIAEYLQKSGIPYTFSTKAGAIANFKLEHVWVEAYVPYSNYRGTRMDENGETWLPLDTSVKVAAYTSPETVDVTSSIDAAAFRDSYLGALQDTSPREEVRELVEQSALGISYEDALHTRSPGTESLGILPGALQLAVKNVSNEYTAIPDELLHKVRFAATDMQGGGLFDLTLDLLALSNRSVALRFEAETVEDQEIIDAYGGLDRTPAYLVHLRPVLSVDGERLAVATDGLPMGSDFTLTIDLVSPRGTETIENVHVAGNLSVIGIAAGHALVTEAAEGADAEALLHEAASEYMHRWDDAEAEFSALYDLRTARPLPTVVTMGGLIDVSYVWGLPHEFDWRGVYIDANMRAVETAPAVGGADDAAIAGFMTLSALEGSAQEHKIFEDLWGLDAISTTKLLGYTEGVGAGTVRLAGTAAQDTISALPYDDEILDDLANAVNAGYEVLVPEVEQTYQDWTGTGYTKENVSTGEAGYMLSGMVAGGMTVGTVTGWPSWLFTTFGETYGYPDDLVANAEGEDPRCGTEMTLYATGGGLAETLSSSQPGVDEIRIVQPSADDAIDAASGIVLGRTGSDLAGYGVAVTSYGMENATSSGDVYSDGEYFASKVTFLAGPNIVNAVAMGYAGEQALSSVSVSSSGVSAGVTLSALSSRGVLGSPDDRSTSYSVTFSASLGDALEGGAATYAWDVDGDGRADISCSDPTAPTAVYRTAGIYLPTLTVTDTVGNLYRDSAIVQVEEAGEMSSEIAAVWEAMKEALAARDVDSALKYFVDESREYYRSVYTALYDSLPQIVAGMREIEPVYLKDSGAKYRIKKAETLADGSVFDVTYYIYFLKGEDGLWKIYLY